MQFKLRILVFITVLTSKMSFCQVDLNTGAASMNIPLYSYIDPSNRIGTAVSLSYTAGNGLKTYEIPSSVGTGWILSVGGVIQRLQHGEPDDQKNNDSYLYPNSISNSQQAIDFYQWVSNYYPNGFLYSEYSPSLPITNGAAYIPLFESSCVLYKPHQKYQPDLEQDIFSCMFNGRTVYFVIGKPNSQTGISEIRTLSDTKLVIKEIYGDLNNTSGIRTTISEFQVTDENGIKYFFRNGALTQVADYKKTYFYDTYGNSLESNANCLYSSCLSSPCSSSNEVSYVTLIKGEPKSSFVKNQWYLSEILNPLTGASISFEYESYSIDMNGEINSMISTMNSRSNLSLSQDRILGTGLRLKKIETSSTEEVEFIYSTQNRKDLEFDKYLEAINIKVAGTIKQKWVFAYGYFVKDEIKNLSHSYTLEEKRWARLCLLSLNRVGIDNFAEPPYLFTYYLGTEDNLNSAVPPIFTFQHDYWGYYNPSSYGFYDPVYHSTIPSNSPYEPYGDKTLSKEMYKELTFNTSTYRTPTIEARNGILKTITNPMMGQVSFEYEQNKFSTNTKVGGVRVSKVSEFDGISHANDKIVEYKYVDDSGNSSGWGYEPFLYSRIDSVRVYKSTSNFYSGIGYEAYGSAWFKSVNSQYQIRSVRQYNDPGDFSILGDYFLSVGMSTLMNCLVNYFMSIFSDMYQDYTGEIYSSIPFNSHNLLPFQYRRVDVVHKLGAGDIGKIKYEFTSDVDYTPDISSLGIPFSSRQRFPFWQYGLEKTVTVLDKNSNPVSRLENSYTILKYDHEDPLFESQKWMASKRKYDELFSPFNDPTSTNIKYETYYPMCGRAKLIETKEFKYRSPTEYIVLVKLFQYSDENFQVSKISTTNSKGDLIENYKYYPLDYEISGAMQELKNKNMVNLEIASQTFITRDTEKYLIGGDVSEYSILSNGDIKPTKSYIFRSDQPIPESQVAFNSTQLIPNTTFYEEVGSIGYDASGIPVQFNNESGKFSVIYDHDKRSITATVSNAVIDDIAYSSFETSVSGNWNLNSPEIIEDYSPTGKRSLKLFSTPSSISKTVDITKSYVLSFWAKAGVPYVYKVSAGIPSTYSPVKTYFNPAIGWTYYEYQIINAAEIFVDNSLNGTQNLPTIPYYLDELRLYPVNARMQSTTIDVLVGKTTECDANNHITFYEYDQLGRLRLIRDENRNVVKAYEYNYKQ